MCVRCGITQMHRAVEEMDSANSAQRNHCQSEQDSSSHRLVLHWAGGVHSELSVGRNPSGQHRRRAERTVIVLVSELAKVCPDKAMAAILNRLGFLFCFVLC